MSLRVNRVSNQPMRTVLICVLLGVGFSGPSSVAAQQPLSTSVCAVMNEPPAFAGRIVKLRATAKTGFEYSIIVDANQSSCKSPSFEIAPKKELPSHLDGYDAELQRLQPVFLVEDENMKRFDDALDAVVYPRDKKVLFVNGNPPRYAVTATMTGRVDYAGERGLGFGHMNSWRVRFVLSSVEDVTTEVISYDWKKFSTVPVHSPHGTIRGRVTDANGKPIKSAWVGAIPSRGTVPIVFADALTEEDGSYSLDVEPGKYFVVVNRYYPATEDVPILTTYFPSAETESGARSLRIVDHTLLTGIDIRIHRVLTPRLFDVQVLSEDGKPASEAYAYLTQTDRVPIAGSDGGVITHADSGGRARLLGFEGIDYLLWAHIGSFPSERCALVIRLDRNQVYAEPIVIRISLAEEACTTQEDEALSAAYATLPRRAPRP